VIPDLGFRDSTDRAARGRAVYGEVGWRQPLPAGWMLDVGLGYVDSRALGRPGYAFGSGTLSTDIGSLRAMLTLIDSEAARKGRPAALAGRRWLVSVWQSF